MESIAEAVVAPVVKSVIKQIGYMTSCTRYVRDMGIKMMELDAARVDVEERLDFYTRSRLKVPSEVMPWMEEVGKIHAMVENIPSDAGSCFSFRIRYKLGKKAVKIIKEIESATWRHSGIYWTDNRIPIGEVDPMKAFIITPSSDHNNFESRDRTFEELLQALQANHESHMIALWGMAGVGKTTMMKRLKNVVQINKMFNYIVEVVIGEKPNPIDIQQAVADYLGVELNEKTTCARADMLRESVDTISRGGMNILVILDDVWQFIDLNDIGFGPFRNRGVSFKVLLTSRDKDVCTRMGVEGNSIVNVGLLMEAEAQSLFFQIVQVSGDDDPELHKIGEEIVRRCCGLPSAIKSMASTLKYKSKDAWRYELYNLKKLRIPKSVTEVFEGSYRNLQDEDAKSIFLLCGLFPGDFNIPTEDLLIYAWGLKLFQSGSTIREARNILNTCIERLIHTNLLLESDDVGCVKMHDLVLAFVWDMFSRGENASFVKYGSTQQWPTNDMSTSCERISLTCMGMSEFPRDLRFPNLSFLKLRQGDESLRFPNDFYGEMEKLQVIAYEKMKYPLLPSSLECSTNLRVLHLHQCPLMFDWSSIGELLNLEVLSLANSGIEWLPSTVGNLTKLRLLDLTNCLGLRIDNGVLKRLVKLEELYITVDERTRSNDRKSISFTDDENCNEMAERSKYLSALEFEFFQNDVQPKNMSFQNLERFKISMGRSLKGAFTKSKHSFENTLKLVTNKRELFESRMNELFDKTNVLCLAVDDMKDLEDVEVKSLLPRQFSSFYNLRSLVVSECAELRYLFTLNVTKALSNLEHLEVYSCNNMEELINTESGGEEKITFHKLKFLSLIGLPNLLGLCRNVNIIELPQLVELGLGAIPYLTSIYPKNNSSTSCFLSEEVVIPKLEKLQIHHMENLKEIWPCEFRAGEDVNVSLLRNIEVMDCDNLVNLFPCNPMPFLHHLEHLQVRNCGSIEVLFNIDLDCVGEIEQEGGSSSSSRLRSIEVYQLEKLKELWRIKNASNPGLLIHGFEAVEYIEITKCKMFRNVFTPTTTNFLLGALKEIWINNKGESGRNNGLLDRDQEQEIDLKSNEGTSKSDIDNSISDVVFTSDLIHSFNSLQKLKLWNSKGVEVVFEISSPRRELETTEDNQQRLLPCLEDLDIRHMDDLSRVWKCNWGKFLFFEIQQSESPFHKLTTIHISACKNIKYLFSPRMATLLSNLKNVKIAICDDIEEVVSSRDDEDEEMATSFKTVTTFFPRLEVLTLDYLRNLNYIGGGGGANLRSNELSSDNTTTIVPKFLDRSKSSQMDGVSWSLCQFSSEISIVDCHALPCVVPSYAVGQMQKLRVLKIKSCKSMKEVFETKEIDNCGSSSTNVDEENGGALAIPVPNNVILLQLPNLKILEVEDCGLLEHVFMFSVLESLTQLEELIIKNCKAMKVIVKEENTPTSNVVIFRRLKSIALVNLPNLLGFFLGMNEFQWPLLDKVTIEECSRMISFKPSRSRAQVSSNKIRPI